MSNPAPPAPPYEPGPYLTAQSGYRPPFAPHGPYAGAYPPVPPGPPAPPALPPKPPKPPKERSALFAATFSLIPVAIGVVLMLDLLNVASVHTSTYFAAVLFTIALGLLVGTWLGRARWLIALGLAAALGLGIATLAESQVGDDTSRRRVDVVWQPTTVQELQSSYDVAFGDATLDLTNVDFTGQDRTVNVNVNVGELRITLPPTVDVVGRVELDAGDARVFDGRISGFQEPPLEFTNLGDDGAGGGNLRLNVHVNAGDVEVTR